MANATLGTPIEPESAPDVIYLRNTGLALLGFTLMAGAISVVGALKTSESLEMAQSAESASPADDSLLQLMEQSISAREMFQTHYANSRSI